MDIEWFKNLQQRAGVTSSDIGQKLGRDRTIVARIYAGRQRMTFEQAEVFAFMLGVSVEDVLTRAGLRRERSAAQVPMMGDVAPFDHSGVRARMLDQMVAAIVADGYDVDVWHVETNAMRLAGYLPGDWLLVDPDAVAAAASGDTVIAQAYDPASGKIKMLLRQMQKPALVAHSIDPADWPLHIVDDHSVIVRGVVIASCRVKSCDANERLHEPDGPAASRSSDRLR
jgi:SOS-response transcriptional repressor LexA